MMSENTDQKYTFIGIGNTNTIDTTVTTPASENFMSVGPISIDPGVTVTIGTGGTWIMV